MASFASIPAERTKTGKEHRVPLSPPAVAILEEMLEVKVSDYVFPSKVEDRPLSNMALLQLLKRMSYPDITVHGFRSTFRDWVSEVSAHSDSLGEMALAHTVGNKVEAAYRRGDSLDKRRLLMADWAKFCTYES